jgi:hypothetical protein
MRYETHCVDDSCEDFEGFRPGHGDAIAHLAVLAALLLASVVFLFQSGWPWREAEDAEDGQKPDIAALRKEDE